ncbi:hypothetical protein EC960932_2330, partial [Escherichia coli 96.0932]
MNYELLLLN